MTFARLLWRNLLYHRRGNFAVFLGVTLGTAVLTGALLVGDSLRGSLRALALDQLGWVDQAMVTPRFFREKLADELSAEQSAPTILLQASIQVEGADPPRRAGKVTLLAVDDRFWPKEAVPLTRDFWQSQKKEVVLNAPLAKLLNVEPGQEVSINVQKADAIPRESLLGKRRQEDAVESLMLKVKEILPDDGMARFTLKPSPEPVRNAFVPLRLVQDLLELPGQANAILVGRPKDTLASDLRNHLTLEDWNLRLRTPAERARTMVKQLGKKRKLDKLPRKSWEGRVPKGLADQADKNGVLTTRQFVDYFEKERRYLSLESQQLFLDSAVVDAVMPEARHTETFHRRWQLRPLMIYLADTANTGAEEIPYVVIAGVSDLGMTEDEMLISSSMLSAKQIPPFAVNVTYYLPDESNRLQKRMHLFTVRRTFELANEKDDPDLTPEFPGITDQLDIRNWENPPFPFNAKRLKPADEQFWQRYRATPRAYIALETAQKLWAGRFGTLTSIQAVDMGGEDPEWSAAAFRLVLLSKLDPKQGGFVFQSVKDLSLRAGGGATDFGMLFLAFSFFLIAAALLLVGLLFRLNLDRRASEMGLLLATGWSRRRVRWLLLGEGTLLAVAGGLLGLLASALYAQQMIRLLQSRWPGGEGLAFLHVHARPSSFAIGYVCSLTASVLTIVWATRVLSRLAPRALLAGESTTGVNTLRSGRWSHWLAIGGMIGAIAFAMAGANSSQHGAKALGFFGCGACALIGLLAGLAWWFGHAGRASSPQPSLGLLGVRNAGRHRVRSLLTVGLLASATFLLTAVQSFHKEAGAEFARRDGGSGGFALMAETAVPVFQDLNDPAVRTQLDLPKDLFAGVEIYSCRLRGGDDASCLNLYQPLKPRILGVPEKLLTERPGRFAFSAGVEYSTSPWATLRAGSAANGVPVFADANTAEWILKIGLGDTVALTDDSGNDAKLQIAGLLKESIFQSELIMTDDNFLKLFPRQQGFNYFLIDCGDQSPPKVQDALGKAFAGHGIEVMPTRQRIEAYLAVENMYLGTFQALGQLGLLLGAVGLAIVLLRSVWERRGELALMQALGFRKTSLAWLVLVENSFLLLAGLGIGAVAALLAVAPRLLISGGDVLWLRLAVLLALVMLVGMAAGGLAIVSTLRTPLLTALRRE